MLAKRIIPCLDVRQGKVVKGVRFLNLKVEGDPAELAAVYEAQGADELVFLDITASYERRGTMLDLVRRTADTVSIPFTVGGGIRNLADIREVLTAGADKVSLNTAAVRNPKLIKKAAKIFGTQCIVVSFDAKRIVQKKQVMTTLRVQKQEITPPTQWEIFTEGGRVPSKIDAISWAQRAKELGAGELLPTSMDCDGTQNGYDISLTREVSEVTNLPIIASGGAGNLRHIFEVLTEGKADAALAASIFHRSQYSIREVKEYLDLKGVSVRLT